MGMNAWILASRPKTLPAAVAPVLLAAAAAWADGRFDPVPACICLAFALLIQVGTNFANDYHDFVKGADTAERVGPTRAVAAGLLTPAAMKRATWLVFAAAFAVGLLLVPYGGWWLVAVGVSSVLFGYAYTGGPYPLGYNGVADPFVFVFFGCVAVTCSYFVTTGQRPGLDILAISFVPGALSVNLLAVNNHRDAETDKKAGKRTPAVRFGRGFVRAEYITCLAIALLVPALLPLSGRGPWIWLALATAPEGIATCKAFLDAQDGPAHNRVLGRTARYLALHSAALAAALVLDKTLR